MSSRVLITGATGHVGAAVLIKALQEGYSVVAAVRSVSSSKAKILKVPEIKDHGLGASLTFVEVPDIMSPSAYHEAIKGVDYVIHVASPLPHPHFAEADLQAEVIEPAVAGTLNMLQAALTNPGLKRVVITSSVVANSNILDASAVSGPDTREPAPPATDLMMAYVASKHEALLASDRFMEEKQPHFDLVNVMPSFVIGRKALAASADDAVAGSNGQALGFTVKSTNLPYSWAAATVHVDDVAHVHVAALKLPGKKVRSLGLNTDMDPNQIFGILKKHFPKAVEEGVFQPLPEPQKFHFIKWDPSETEKVLGIKFKSVEEQLVSVGRQFLELQGKA